MDNGDQGGGAFTDRPIPPWELPGNFRRDCEPHRAQVVQVLAGLGLSAGAGIAWLCLLASMDLFMRPPGPDDVIAYSVLGVVALTGICLGGQAWLLARRDLGRMRLGMMDPAGEELTRGGGSLGALGVLLALAGMLLPLLVWSAGVAARVLGWQ